MYEVEVNDLQIHGNVVSGKIILEDGQTAYVSSYYCPTCARKRNEISRDGESWCIHKEALTWADYRDERDQAWAVSRGLG